MQASSIGNGCTAGAHVGRLLEPMVDDRMQATPPSVSFVCCVESGFLEAQTVRMVESLRRHAGRYASAPIYAVTPRLGPPLSPHTRRVFERFGVTHLAERAPDSLDWFKFRNKPKAMVIADRAATTDVLCWVDSDIVFVGEPDELAMTDVDFIASASDKEMGSAGPGDAYEPFWAAMCEIVGVAPDDLPWVTNEMDQTRVRLYWNSGFFAFRRDKPVAAEFLRLADALLLGKTRPDAPGFSLGINEMAAIGFAMVTLGLRFKALAFTHNYPIGSRTPPECYSDATLAEVRVLHYHDAMWLPGWPKFIGHVERVHPQVAAWLKPLGPMQNFAPHWCRALSRVLRALRQRKESAHLASCRVV